MSRLNWLAAIRAALVGAVGMTETDMELPGGRVARVMGQKEDLPMLGRVAAYSLGRKRRRTFDVPRTKVVPTVQFTYWRGGKKVKFAASRRMVVSVYRNGNKLLGTRP